MSLSLVSSEKEANNSAFTHTRYSPPTSLFLRRKQKGLRIVWIRYLRKTDAVFLRGIGFFHPLSFRLKVPLLIFPTFFRFSARRILFSFFKRTLSCCSDVFIVCDLQANECVLNTLGEIKTTLFFPRKFQKRDNQGLLTIRIY